MAERELSEHMDSLREVAPDKISDEFQEDFERLRESWHPEEGCKVTMKHMVLGLMVTMATKTLQFMHAGGITENDEEASFQSLQVVNNAFLVIEPPLELQTRFVQNIPFFVELLQCPQSELGRYCSGFLALIMRVLCNATDTFDEGAHCLADCPGAIDTIIHHSTKKLDVGNPLLQEWAVLVLRNLAVVPTVRERISWASAQRRPIV